MSGADYEIVRRIAFSAGHRVHGHESKCRHFHGHNYVAYFHALPRRGLDPLGRVIDFGVIKARLNSTTGSTPTGTTASCSGRVTKRVWQLRAQFRTRRSINCLPIQRPKLSPPLSWNALPRRCFRIFR
jgi:hypothetical protein